MTFLQEAAISLTCLSWQGAPSESSKGQWLDSDTIHYICFPPTELFTFKVQQKNSTITTL